MKISSTLPSLGTTGTKGTRAPSAPASRPETGSSERIDISSLSARLQEVGSSEAPIDMQKIGEIKLAISEGRFQINPERIADGLLNSVRDMLGRGSQTA